MFLVDTNVLVYAADRAAAPRLLVLSGGKGGVGKTSVGMSIAEALGRRFYRFSLGGMRDDQRPGGRLAGLFHHAARDRVDADLDLDQANTPSAWRCLEYLQLPASPYLWADKSRPVTGLLFPGRLSSSCPR